MFIKLFTSCEYYQYQNKMTQYPKLEKSCDVLAIDSPGQTTKALLAASVKPMRRVIIALFTYLPEFSVSHGKKHIHLVRGKIASESIREMDIWRR